MEIILSIILLLFLNWLFSQIGRGIAAGGKSAVRAAQGKGSFSGNVKAELQGLGPLEIRKSSFQVGDDGSGLEGLAVEIRGLMPVRSPTNLHFVTSVIDQTGDQVERPVLSTLEVFQESRTTAYQSFEEGCLANPGAGFVDWVRVGAVFPDLLWPARGGGGKLTIMLRVVDADNMPEIHAGFCNPDDGGVLAVKSIDYQFNYQGKGYEEAAADRDEARKCAVELALVVAMSDGVLHESEGRAIQDWVRRTVEAFSGQRRDELKTLYRDAMRSAYEGVRTGDLAVSSVTTRLNEIGADPQKYEAIELCFDVMSADGVAGDSELNAIRGIAEALELDYAEIEKLRDKGAVNLPGATIEMRLGIEEDWSKEKKRKYLREAYTKWNNRRNNLPEGPERDSAQQLLDEIAIARKKYVD